MRGTDLKFDTVILIDSEGERSLDVQQLPLRIGTGTNCEVRLPGPGSRAVALLDELDGEPFVQPVGTTGAIKINGEVLATSRKLLAGDQLEFFGSVVAVAEADGAMRLTVRLEGSAYVTKPPELTDTSAGPAEETIVATAFRRTAETAPVDIKPTGVRWQTIVGSVIVVLGLTSSLLFTSKSIQFDVQPAGMDEISITGGWFKLPVGERILMRTGTYTVNVRKQGYYDVAQSLQIGDKPSRTVIVEMRKLPGQLTVVTEPAVDAFVTVDDTRVGRAPFGPLELEPGTHSVTVTADQYLPFT